MSNQTTLEGGDLWGILDMTSGLLGMQYKLRILAGINLDLSRWRKVHIRGSFQALPFRDGAFDTVLFDPPHTIDARNTLEGTMGSGSGMGPHMATFPYGSYKNIKDLRVAVANGAKEAERVLKIGGDMIFKWSTSEKPFSWALDAMVKAAPNLDKYRINAYRSQATWKNYTMYAWFRKRSLVGQPPLDDRGVSLAGATPGHDGAGIPISADSPGIT